MCLLKAQKSWDVCIKTQTNFLYVDGSRELVTTVLGAGLRAFGGTSFALVHYTCTWH